MSLKGSAAFLKVAETVYTIAQEKELPTFKVHGQWRFRRKHIDRQRGEGAEAGSDE